MLTTMLARPEPVIGATKLRYIVEAKINWWYRSQDEFAHSNHKSTPGQVKLLGSECQTSGTYAKTAKQATKKDNAAACLCFLNYLASLRPAADRAASILPWIVSPGRSYGFL
jgi:hypothetical protein